MLQILFIKFERSRICLQIVVNHEVGETKNRNSIKIS